MELTIINHLRSINRQIALLVGLGLVGMGAFVVLDILLRQFHTSLGGSEELAGYAMALASAWGMSYALLELAHIRIDLLRSRSKGLFRAIFDILALLVLAVVVLIIAMQCWPLVERAWVNESRANTPLSTPLFWVQLPWFLGWAWFAASSFVLAFSSMALTLKGDLSAVEKSIGTFAEGESQV